VTRKKRSKQEKISAGFAARLDRLGPRQKVHAILFLQTDIDDTSSKRQRGEERAAAIEATRRSAEQALSEVDDILARFDGQRLADRPDVLGSIPVETTTAGVKALASSEWVTAILEDQQIHLIS
jgi:sorbitol-specific phosphotransferase system component IIA